VFHDLRIISILCLLVICPNIHDLKVKVCYALKPLFQTQTDQSVFRCIVGAKVLSLVEITMFPNRVKNVQFMTILGFFYKLY